MLLRRLGGRIASRLDACRDRRPAEDTYLHLTRTGLTATRKNPPPRARRPCSQRAFLRSAREKESTALFTLSLPLISLLLIVEANDGSHLAGTVPIKRTTVFVPGILASRYRRPYVALRIKVGWHAPDAYSSGSGTTRCRPGPISAALL